jgi:hypothetical protein
LKGKYKKKNSALYKRLLHITKGKKRIEILPPMQGLPSSLETLSPTSFQTFIAFSEGKASPLLIPIDHDIPDLLGGNTLAFAHSTGNTGYTRKKSVLFSLLKKSTQKRKKAKKKEAPIGADKEIRPLSQPSESEFSAADTDHRGETYVNVREHSSTGSTHPKTNYDEWGKRAIEEPVAVDSSPSVRESVPERCKGSEEHKKNRVAFVLMWGMFFTGTSLFLTLFFKEKALLLWSQSGRKVGNPHLVRLEHVHYALIPQGRGHKIVVTGECINRQDESQALAPLSLSVYKPLEPTPFFSWKHILSQDRILPQEHLFFRTEASIPDAVDDNCIVAVVFDGKIA